MGVISFKLSKSFHTISLLLDLISGYLNGARAIVSHIHLVAEFYSNIHNHESTQYLACKILRNLTEKTESRPYFKIFHISLINLS